MKTYKYIITSQSKRVGKIILNRPEVHNAFNIEMIREVSEAFSAMNKQSKLRIIQFEATGKNFSAGADLNWMKEGLHQSKEELLTESKEMAMLFNEIYHSNKVTIVLAKGRVIGGANGIIAASDIVFSVPETSFAFSEVKLGLIPATIAPYIVLKSGKSVAREWMLTGRRIEAHEAFNRGLTNHLVELEELENEVQKLSEGLLQNGPDAMHGIKELFRLNELDKSPDEQIDSSAKRIAAFRIAAEGQEGIKAFFEKRKPDWSNEKEKNK